MTDKDYPTVLGGENNKESVDDDTDEFLFSMPIRVIQEKSQLKNFLSQHITQESHFQDDHPWERAL